MTPALTVRLPSSCGRASRPPRGELRTARQALLADGVRLLTMTGPPVVGKTSLALALRRELAEQLRHGARLVDLAPIHDPVQVVLAMVDALGVAAMTGRRPLDCLIRAMGDRERLVILDNFELIVAAAPLIGDLLGACPSLRVVVTSRWR